MSGTMRSPERPSTASRSARPGGPTWPRVAGAVAAAQAARYARDPIALFFLVVVPVLLTLLLGLANPDEGGPRAIIGVAVADRPDAAAQRVLDAIDAHDRLALELVEDADALGASLRRGTLAAGLVLPPDLGARSAAGEAPIEVEFVPGPGTGGAAARAAVGEVIAEQGARLGAAAFAADQSDAPLSSAEDAVGEPGATSLRVESDASDDARALVPSGFDHTAPANLVLFVFVNTLIAGGTLTDARSSGVARRLWASPAAPSAVLAGEGLAKLAIALGQAALLVVVSATLFGVDWGDPVGVAAVIVLFSLASTGAALLVGSLARTTDQVVALGPGIGIALAALGGALWPLAVVADWLQRLAYATPHGWAMEALGDLVSRDASAADVAGALGGLALFAAALLAGGLAAGRVALRRQ